MLVIGASGGGLVKGSMPYVFLSTFSSNILRALSTAGVGSLCLATLKAWSVSAEGILCEGSSVEACFQLAAQV